jgi:hypothetical protein
MSPVMMSGVMIAPMEVPLCNTLLPSERSRASSSARVVRMAQGQCPASKKPSAMRHHSSSCSLCTKPVASPASDHIVSTPAYSQRTEKRSASQPNTMEPAAKA